MALHARFGLVALGSTALLAAALNAWQPADAAEHAVRQNDDPGPVPVLVELFTSEGCSSCPPADALLHDLLTSQPVEGTLVIGLSEHVDYWNRLGWTDPFSDQSFSARQSAYAAAVRSGEVYTPQMVVDGAASFIGSDRTRALREIALAATRSKATIGLGWADAGRLDVRLSGGHVKANTPVWLAITENELTVSVRRGENANRTLTHDGVTRRLTQAGHTDRAGAFSKRLPVQLDATWKTGATRLTVFTQQAGEPVTALGSIRVSDRATDSARSRR